MATAAELKRKKRLYKECLANVKNTGYELKSSIEKINSLLNIQGSCYKVDDVNGGSNYLDYLLETENSIYSNIVNNIIPGLNSKINNLEWQITDAEQKEALEKAGV